jgi:hypothetical protein
MILDRIYQSQLSYWENIGVLFGIAAFYYLVAFIFMIKKSSS